MADRIFPNGVTAQSTTGATQFKVDNGTSNGRVRIDAVPVEQFSFYNLRKLSGLAYCFLRTDGAGAVSTFETDLNFLPNPVPISGPGFPAFTSGGAAIDFREIEGTTGQITVTDGDGAAANPVISLPATITQAETFTALHRTLVNTSFNGYQGSNAALVQSVESSRTLSGSDTLGDKYEVWRVGDGRGAAGAHRVGIFQTRGSVAGTWEYTQWSIERVVDATPFNAIKFGTSTINTAIRMDSAVCIATEGDAGTGAALYLPTATTGGILFGDVLVNRGVASYIKVAGSILSGKVSSTEGGQLGMCRSSDDTEYWYWDVNGSTSTPVMRLVVSGTGAVNTVNPTGEWGFGGAAPVVSSGLIQLAVGTTAAAGILFGDTPMYRIAASSIALDGAFTTLGTTAGVQRSLLTRNLSNNASAYTVINVGNDTSAIALEIFTQSSANSGVVAAGGSCIYTSGAFELGFGTNATARMILTVDNLRLNGMTTGTSAAGVIAIANGTAPSTSPAGGGQLYAEAGALKWRGSSGTVTTLGPA